MSHTSPFPNPDQLGAMGEAKFAEMCESVGLIANKSTRDRNGWDYIVAFNHDDAGNEVTLDARAAPASCHVQVKTVLDKTPEVKLRLSSAEWLAKELKPAFIYVLKVSASLEYTDAYIIHILNDVLAKVLRRLRKVQADGGRRPNDVFLSISIKKYGKRIAPTGPALRKELAEASGQKMAAYIANKEQQLKTLGFEKGAYQLTAQFNMESKADFIEALLGVRKEIDTRKISTSSLRFGIKLPHKEYENARVVIQAKASDTCRVTIRSKHLSTPATVLGRIYFAPKIPEIDELHSKARIDTDVFSITVASPTTDISTKSDFRAIGMTLWSAFWSLAVVLGEGSGEIEVSSTTSPFSVPITIAKVGNGVDLGQARSMLTATEQASFLLKQAGALIDPILEATDMFNLSREVTVPYRMLTDRGDPLVATFDGEKNEIVSGTSIERILFVSYASIGSIKLGYCAMLDTSTEENGKRVTVKSTAVSFKQIRILNDFPNGYASFADAAKASFPASAFYIRPAGAAYSIADDGQLQIPAQREQ